MKKLNVVYNDNYDIPLPEGHRFVGTKFSDLYNFIKNSNLYTNLTIHQSKSAPINDVQVVHNRNYVMSVKEGNLSRDQERRINLPWSEKLAKRSFLAIQGTLQTSQLALDYGNHFSQVDLLFAFHSATTSLSSPPSRTLTSIAA